MITPTVLPDRGDASLDVGAPAPAAERTEGAGSEAAVPGTVEPATLESVRDDVEEVVVEQALAQERNRHTAAVSTEPARNGAAEVVPSVDLANDGVAAATDRPRRLRVRPRVRRPLAAGLRRHRTVSRSRRPSRPGRRGVGAG